MVLVGEGFKTAFRYFVVPVAHLNRGHGKGTFRVRAARCYIELYKWSRFSSRGSALFFRPFPVLQGGCVGLEFGHYKCLTGKGLAWKCSRAQGWVFLEVFVCV